MYRKHFFRWTTFIFLNDLGPHCHSSDVQYMPQTLPSIFTQCFFAGGKVGAHLGTEGIKDSSPAPSTKHGIEQKRTLSVCKPMVMKHSLALPLHTQGQV